MVITPLQSASTGSATAAASRATAVDLSGMDYDARRRRLFATLGALRPGEQVELISDRADDVGFLRYEWETRTPRRYCWSVPDEDDTGARVTVHIPAQRRR